MELLQVFTDPTGVEPWRLGETELVSVTGALNQHIVECEALRVRLARIWRAGARRRPRVRCPRPHGWPAPVG